MRYALILLATTATGGQAQGPGAVRHVPSHYRTVQAGIEAAAPGDTVLIAAGVYRESVRIATPRITLRGTDRRTVVLDGEFTRDTVVAVTADEVAIEDLTVQRAGRTGIAWHGVSGWRGRNVTVRDARTTGIASVGSTAGTLTSVVVTGSAATGVHIADCASCRTRMSDVTVEANGVGIVAQNVSGLELVQSMVRGNQAGIVVEGTKATADPPVRIIRNVIADNRRRGPAASGADAGAYGNGILLKGTTGVIVEWNTIVGHPLHGVLIAPRLSGGYRAARRNIVRDNDVRMSGRAEVALAGPWSSDNCAARNGSGPMSPVLLTFLAGCDRRVFAMGLDVIPTLAMWWRRHATADDAATGIGGAAWTGVAARTVFGGAAMWWTLGLPLWGIGALVDGVRRRRIARGLLQLTGAVAATTILIGVGAIWYGSIT